METNKQLQNSTSFDQKLKKISFNLQYFVSILKNFMGEEGLLIPVIKHQYTGDEVQIHTASQRNELKQHFATRSVKMECR